MSLKRLTPALLQRTCTFPSTRSVSSAARANASRSVTSSRIACTSPSSSARRRLEVVGADVCDRHPHACRDERLRHAEPDSAAASGDEGDSALRRPACDSRPYRLGGSSPSVWRRLDGDHVTRCGDVVGSLLRPEYLREAREAARAGTIDADELRAVEDRAVLEAIALQESAGIEAITDGEYRRSGWIALIPMVDDPLFDPAGERLRVPERGVRLARPLEDGRRRAGRHVGAAARGAVRHAAAPGRARHRRRRVLVPEGERPRAREVHDPGPELAPDLLAPRLLDRRLSDVGRLHPRTSPA